MLTCIDILFNIVKRSLQKTFSLLNLDYALLALNEL